MSSDPLNFKVSCPKCGMTELVNYTPPTNDDKAKIPGLPIPKIIKEEIFSISYNHKDHTFIVNFSREGKIKSAQAMNRIDKSIESLSAKLVQQAISLAEQLEEKKIEVLIISPSKIFRDIVKTLSGLLLRNIPPNLKFEVIRSALGSNIKVGNFTINYYPNPVQVVTNAIQKDELFVLLDGREEVSWNYNYKPPQTFLIVESLMDLTNSSRLDIMKIIEEIKPTSYFQGKSTPELIDSISNVLSFITLSQDL